MLPAGRGSGHRSEWGTGAVVKFRLPLWIRCFVEAAVNRDEQDQTIMEQIR